jgi:chromosome segregation protein
LGDGETEAQNAERATRAAEAALSAAREHLVRAEGEAAQADHAWGSVVERILERLGAEASLPPPDAPGTLVACHAVEEGREAD